jgi:hypothetical protein
LSQHKCHMKANKRNKNEVFFKRPLKSKTTWCKNIAT